YGDKPVFVLTSRKLPRTRDTVEFHSGDLVHFVNTRLRARFRSIWFVGGGMVSGECLRVGLADEVRYSILPILIDDGIQFFEKLDRDVALHLVEVKAYKRGTVELGYEVRGCRGGPHNATYHAMQYIASQAVVCALPVCHPRFDSLNGLTWLDCPRRFSRLE